MVQRLAAIAGTARTSAVIQVISDGDLKAALGRITVKTVVLPITQDQYLPASVCKAEAQLIAHARFKSIDSPFGHLGSFGADATWLRQANEKLGRLPL